MNFKSWPHVVVMHHDLLVDRDHESCVMVMDREECASQIMVPCLLMCWMDLLMCWKELLAKHNMALVTIGKLFTHMPS